MPRKGGGGGVGSSRPDEEVRAGSGGGSGGGKSEGGEGSSSSSDTEVTEDLQRALKPRGGGEGRAPSDGVPPADTSPALLCDEGNGGGKGDEPTDVRQMPLNPRGGGGGMGVDPFPTLLREDGEDVEQDERQHGHPHDVLARQQERLPWGSDAMPP